jgi:saccharopine dehydrogenase (NAD+, L-lysine forming)
MSRVLIIGAGGVGNVVVHKCAQIPSVFSEIMLAGRTKSKCDKIAEDVRIRTGETILTAQIDADHVSETIDLIRSFNPDLVINVALPYQDLAIMEACLETGVDYLDTANYEHPDEARFEYKWQWAFHDRFKEKGIMALLGSGFDPGVTNVFCVHALKHRFDEIHELDIIDCNAGDHGHPFATNFNPEINIREVTAKGRFWENGNWKETEPLSEVHDL